MKRSILALATAILTTSMLFSQEKGIVFNSRYLPEKKYLTNSESTIEGEISLKTDKKTRELLESSGLLPLKIHNQTDTEVLITTGSMVAGNFPVHFSYVKNHSDVSVAGYTSENDSPLTGALIIGWFDTNNHIEIESITGSYLEESLKKMIIETVESLQGSVKFPDRPMKIGDRFTQEIPFSFPIEGVDKADMKVICTYKLIDIVDSIAVFNIKEKITLNLKNGTDDIKLRGVGSGQSRFSIADSFVISTRDRIAVRMKFLADGKMAKAKMMTSSESEVLIDHYTAFNEEVIEEEDDFVLATMDDPGEETVVEVVEEGSDTYQDYVVEASDLNDEVYVVEDESDDSVTEAAEVAEAAEAVEAVEVVEAEYPGGEVAYFEVPQEIALEGHNWILSELNGKTVANPSPDHSDIYISFSATENNFNGSGGCNSYFGKYTISREGWITLTDIGMTKMACPDMSVEEELIRTLKVVNAYSIEGEKLTLKKGGKYPVAVFTY